VLTPSNVAQPSFYAQYNLQFRLYTVPDLAYALELTGNAAPAPPVNDLDSNFWTDDGKDGAAWLIIADTANAVRQGYIHMPADNDDMQLMERQRRTLLKLTSDLGDPKVVRMWI
jgi:hypothetical protein